MTVRVLPATLDHADILGRNLRAEDELELARLDIEPLNGVLESFALSAWARTALVSGRVAAMWGVVPIEGGGRPWLLTGTPCRDVSTRVFARLYCHEASEMQAGFDRLENHVDASYEKAVRLLAMAGFTLDAPAPHGPRGALFRRFWA